MCFPCFTDRRRKSERNQQNGTNQGEQPIPLTIRSRNSARPPSRRGNNTVAQPPAHTSHRQPTVSTVSPDLERETDQASSQAFSNAPTSGTSSPLPRRQQGRSVSSTLPLSVRAKNTGPNLTTFPEDEEEPKERVPLRGDLQKLPSLNNQHRADMQRTQDHGIEHRESQRNASNTSRLQFGHPSGTPEPHPGTIVPGSLTRPAAPSAQLPSSSSAAAAREPDSRFSSDSDSDGTEVPLPTASPSEAQPASQSRFSDSSSSGEGEPPVASALSSSPHSAPEPGYGTRTNDF